MQNNFEAPALTLIGQADEVVMGIVTGGVDAPLWTPPDFEFEDDSF